MCVGTAATASVFEDSNVLLCLMHEQLAMLLRIQDECDSVNGGRYVSDELHVAVQFMARVLSLCRFCSLASSSLASSFSHIS